jgi:hypothetical protein
MDYAGHMPPRLIYQQRRDGAKGGLRCNTLTPTRPMGLWLSTFLTGLLLAALVYFWKYRTAELVEEVVTPSENVST